MAMYHILSVFRNMQWSNLAARSGDSDQFLHAHRNAPLTAHNPSGHILGIIGLGNIGYRIAQKAYLAFGMKIMYYDPFPRSTEQEAAVGATLVLELDDLLANADCVLIAAPGTGGKTLIDAAKIQKMRRGARIVNIARGSLVDETALADALDSGHLSAVGLDVHADEPNVNPRLRASRFSSLTCHTAGGAFETNVGFEALAIKNVNAVLSGEKPLTPVNLHFMNK
jgi:lactate dehydrogenase-like 2-hydroxyacid dehydrogenase